MGVEAFTAEAFHGFAQEAGVLLFLVEPEVDDFADVLGGTAEGLGVEGDQSGGAAAVTEFKFAEGLEEGGERVGRDFGGGVPGRFRAVFLVPFEVTEPVVGVEMGEGVGF